MNVKYRTCRIENTDVFYRTAGNPANPAVLLLHGFPSSSHMYRDLIPLLSKDFHIVAPDFPGFGQTRAPERGAFEYSFDNIARLMELFTDEIGLTRYAMYVFDYGAPIGFRLAVSHPERITAIVSQNGNVYREGLGKKWAERAQYWTSPTPEGRKKFSMAYAPETIIGQYTFGTPDGSVAPDSYTLDIAYMSIAGRAEIQNDLILDYRTNVARYPEFQQYLCKHQPPLLAVWGKNDPSFIPAGAEAFKKDVPQAEIHFVDSGHFALESHVEEIASIMIPFLKKHIQ